MRGYTGAICLALIAGAAGLCWPGAVQAAELIRGEQRLIITGHDTLAYSHESVSGGELAAHALAYDSLNRDSGLAHRSELVVRGQLLQDVRISGHLSRGGYGPSRSSLTLTFDGNDADVAIGDLSVCLDGNAFIPFTRTLRGMKVDAELDRGALTLLVSRSKAPTKTDVFYGRNSSGPYYLSASPIVDGSEQIAVDGVRMRRGRDYTIDYQVGLLFFDASRIIAPSSKVEAAYEHLSPSGLTGSLLGARAALPVSDRLDVGATFFRLNRPQAAGPDTSPRSDQWMGNNTPGPFPLSYRPVVEGSERVRVGGILQTPNVDYRLDVEAGLLYFLWPVPMGVMIAVDYEVAGEEEVSGGDQSVVGLDLRYRPNGHVNLTGQFAASRGGASPSESGSAVGLKAAGRWSALSLTGNWQAMSRDFAPVDSVGAQGPSSGSDLSLRYQAKPWASLSASLSDYRHAYDTFAAARDDLQVRERERTVALEIAHPRWPRLSLRSTSRRLGNSAAGLRENTESDLLRLDYSRAVFGVTAELERTSTDSVLPSLGWGEWGSVGYGAQPAGEAASGSEWTSYQAITTSRRLGMWYRPHERLQITADLAGNRIRSLSARSDTSAHSRHMGLSYSPRRTLTLDLDYSAYGTGGSQSPDGWETPASNSISRSATLRYTPSARTALSLTHDRQRAEGGYTGGSDSTGTTLAAYLLPCDKISLNATYGIYRLRYLGASGASTNHVVGLAVRATPWRRLALELGYQRMDGVSRGAFADLTADGDYAVSSGGSQRMLSSSLTGRVSYEVGRRHTAFVEAEASRTVGYPSKTRRVATSLGWEYSLSRLVKARVDWRHTVHRDLGDPRYNYVANRLNTEIRLDF